MEIPNIYQGDYRRLIVFPLILILISIYFIPHIKLGVDFTGGTLIVLDLNRSVDATQLQASLAKDGLVGTVSTYNTTFGPKAEIELGQNPDLVRADALRDNFTAKLEQVALLESQANTNSSVMDQYVAERKNLNSISDSLFALAGVKNASAAGIENLNTLNSQTLDAYRAVYNNYKDSISASINKYADYSSLSVQSVSPALSAHFIDNAIRVSIFAAILSTIFVFIFFRTLVPSLAVITGAVSDVVIALGAMGLFGIPLTLASFAALLMLLGFSLDTDILLTMRMLKRSGDPRQKAFDAMKTGLTMSATAFFSFLILYLVSLYTHISIYSEISMVALAGLFADMFATWGINAVTLLLHTEGKI
ncbi:Protein-export membrane protein SecF [uncultured archaeon]|nr:Protein-export membrane protein SecF [uncultured archaeon]